MKFSSEDRIQLSEMLNKYGHESIKSELKSLLNEEDHIKVVVNDCFGGYGFSEVAYYWMIANGYEPKDNEYPNCFTPDRTNPIAVKCVETLGADANGMCAELSIVSVPADADWSIDDYDGIENVTW